MKKVTNITLGGIVFAVEEDAYETLAGYLKSIEVRFADSPDYHEISGDIEHAIAEKFRARKKNEKQAVTKDDVEAVISEMGTPDEVSSEEGAARETSDSETAHEAPIKKRLYRDTDDAIIAGVCSGIAQYFDIDPVIVRVIFFISIFINGLGIIAYIVLWLIVPAAETTAQKYAMRGERMTVADISERVKKNLTDEANIARARGAWGSIRGFLAELFELMGRVLRWCLVVLRYLVGVAFVVFGGLGIAGLVSAASALFFARSELANPAMRDLAGAVLIDATGYVLVIAILVSAFIPLVVIVMVGASMLIRRNLFTAMKSLALFVSWIIALSVATTFSILYGVSIAERMEGQQFQFDDGQGRFELWWDEERGSFELQFDERGMDAEVRDVVEQIPFGDSIEVYDGISVAERSTVLDLSGRGLTGSLKAEIRHLTELETLDLSENRFTGLPAEVGQLRELRVLDLSNNEFTGLPHELGDLAELELLDLRGNAISQFDLKIIRERLDAGTVIRQD